METFINANGRPCIAIVAPGGTRRTVIEMQNHNFRIFQQQRSKEQWLSVSWTDTYLEREVVEAAHRLLRANVMK